MEQCVYESTQAKLPVMGFMYARARKKTAGGRFYVRFIELVLDGIYAQNIRSV